MKFLASLLLLLVAASNLAAHPGHEPGDEHVLEGKLPEEPTHLYVPVDQSDIFAIQLDRDELEDQIELDNFEKIQKEEQGKVKTSIEKK